MGDGSLRDLSLDPIIPLATRIARIARMRIDERRRAERCAVMLGGRSVLAVVLADAMIAGYQQNPAVFSYADVATLQTLRKASFMSTRYGMGAPGANLWREFVLTTDFGVDII